VASRPRPAWRGFLKSAPEKMRGAERRSAHLWSAFRRGAPLAKGARLSALHRGSRQQLSPPLSSGPGFRGPGIGARLVQQAPCRAVLMPPDRVPGAARVRGHEPRPQAPPLLHQPNVSGRRPSARLGGRCVYSPMRDVKDYFHSENRATIPDSLQEKGVPALFLGDSNS
jgi:hypothetical protein